MLRYLDLYEFIFGKPATVFPQPGKNFIYLMFNSKTHLVKIGKSKNPGFREKTLQSEEPEITMIAVWEATDQVERNLHQQYQHKRIRGEWFKLSFEELREIKAQMDQISTTLYYQ